MRGVSSRTATHRICKMLRPADVLFAFLYFQVLSVSTSTQPVPCVSPTATGFRFSLLSSRNATGHWTAQVQLEHTGGHAEAGPWKVDIDHTSVKCREVESILVVATVTVPAVPPQQSHRCDYELVPNHGYYKLHTLAKSWDEARRICLSEGSHLLVLNSAEELIAVKSIWDRNPDFNDTQHKDYIHVGLRKNKENTFLTDSGVPLSDTGYEIWDSTEPNNAGGNESCLSLKVTGGLNDVSCELKLAFMCEKEI